MTSIKDILDKLLEILRDANLENAAGKKIVRWYKGEPPRTTWPGFPWGWCEWAGGIKEPPVGSMAQIRDNFFIVTVDRHIEADRAEDSVMEFCESIEALLDSDRTLGGLVAASYVGNREKDKFFESDKSVCGIRITLHTRRRE